MALSDVIKKREATADETAKKSSKGGISNLLDDVRIVIAVIVLACIALIALIVYNNGQIQQKMTDIDTVKSEIRDNQAKIANLKALQARSSEYLAQKEAYDEMISDEELNQLEIMIDLEEDVEAHNCNLIEITFDDIVNTGLVNQVSVNLKITGSFSDIMSFCRDIVNSTQIKRIDTIRMTGNNEQKTAEIVLVQFSR